MLVTDGVPARLHGCSPAGLPSYPLGSYGTPDRPPPPLRPGRTIPKAGYYLLPARVDRHTRTAVPDHPADRYLGPARVGTGTRSGELFHPVGCASTPAWGYIPTHSGGATPTGGC